MLHKTNVGHLLLYYLHETLGELINMVQDVKVDYIRGSEWRKWDLHVHTPCSIVQEYGADNDATWEKFLADLEALPAEFSVIGINDYLFIDGYRKVLAAKMAGRLRNIDLILPVIELRLDKFGGSASQLSRVNFHVIFSDKIDPDIIEHQFLSALSSKYQLSPQWQGRQIAWGGIPTRQSLSDLGKQIIESVPLEKRPEFNSPLKEGFNNLNLSLNDIQRILDGPYFKGNVLTAVGKTEWESIKWNDQSIADKKTVINSANFVFTAAVSPASCAAGRAKLVGAGVNDRLLDCSDAHRFSSSADKDRIGNCFTWIKADPSFNGLSQTIHEPVDRIFIGHTPPQVTTVRRNPTKFIRGLKIEKTPGSSLDEIWFDGTDLSFGTGLVAVIGNKGSGKSALADILGLLSNSSRHSSVSFLTKERFNPTKQPKGAHFEATITWHNDIATSKLLHAPPDKTAVEYAKYIPQHFFENVCNEIAAGDTAAFDEEIREVIFSHVPADERLGQSSLANLIGFRTSEVGHALSVLRQQLRNVNREILEMMSRASAEYLASQTKLLNAKQVELNAHIANCPLEVSKPGEAADEAQRQGTARIEAARTSLDQIDGLIATSIARKGTLALLLSTADRALQKLGRLLSEITTMIDAAAMDLNELGIDVENVVKLTIDNGLIEARKEALSKERAGIDFLLDEASPLGLPQRRDAILAEIVVTQADLDEPGRKYEAYREALRLWEEKRAAIVGAKGSPASLEYYVDTIDRLSDLPFEIRALKDSRQAITRSIYSKLAELKGVCEDLYRPVQGFIDSNKIAKDQFKLDFDVAICDSGFSAGFFTLVNQGTNGSYCGKEQGEERLASMLERHDFNSEQGAIDFILEVERSLTVDIRKQDPEPVLLSSQVRKSTTPEALYNYIFGLEYLTPRYGLQMAGKSLDRLSPGEKGSLLLVFYLLVDQNDTPLIIDQPEENLDNQTIVSLLVPSIKEAKGRRQIFVVTHNPNIAVVCDAEQVVCAHHDPNDKNRVTYVSGSIENPAINKRIMDVLEGTKPAFENRSAKYQQSPASA
jgi:ABC-type lipoprotein export system ATPase subunit